MDRYRLLALTIGRMKHHYTVEQQSTHNWHLFTLSKMTKITQIQLDCSQCVGLLEQIPALIIKNR
jgi:hypothetical protein